MKPVKEPLRTQVSSKLQNNGDIFVRVLVPAKMWSSQNPICIEFVLAKDVVSKIKAETSSIVAETITASMESFYLYEVTPKGYLLEPNREGLYCKSSSVDVSFGSKALTDGNWIEFTVFGVNRFELKMRNKKLLLPERSEYEDNCTGIRAYGMTGRAPQNVSVGINEQLAQNYVPYYIREKVAFIHDLNASIKAKNFKRAIRIIKDGHLSGAMDLFDKGNDDSPFSPPLATVFRRAEQEDFLSEKDSHIVEEIDELIQTCLTASLSSGYYRVGSVFNQRVFEMAFDKINAMYLSNQEDMHYIAIMIVEMNSDPGDAILRLQKLHDNGYQPDRELVYKISRRIHTDSSWQLKALEWAVSHGALNNSDRNEYYGDLRNTICCPKSRLDQVGAVIVNAGYQFTPFDVEYAHSMQMNETIALIENMRMKAEITSNEPEPIFSRNRFHHL